MDPQPPPQSPSPSPASTPTDVDPEQPQPIPMASAIEKLPPRPAPTAAYNWEEWSPNARTVYLRDSDQANEHLSQLKPCSFGFDLEWKPTYVKGGQENRVALVQLANDGVIFLLQVTAMKEFPSKLREILEDRAFLKAGVGIQGDTKKLWSDWGVSVRGCVDLSLLARTVDNARWKGKYNSSIGLARLVEVYCYRLLAKGKITRSNWEAVLNSPQQNYASNDAHAGYTVRKLLMAMADPNNPPESKYFTFDCDRGYYCEPSGTPWSPVNPNYDPGPLPPPRPPREDKRRRGRDDSQTTPEDEHQQSDPRVIIQRHESVLKIAHSTRLRQQDAAASAIQQGKRPRDFVNSRHVPEPLYTTSPPSPHHFRNNSYHAPNQSPSSSRTTSQAPSPPLSPPHRSNHHPNFYRGRGSFHHGYRGRWQHPKPPTAPVTPAQSNPPQVQQPQRPQQTPSTSGEMINARDEKRARTHYRPRRPKQPTNPPTAEAAV